MQLQVLKKNRRRNTWQEAPGSREEKDARAGKGRGLMGLPGLHSSLSAPRLHFLLCKRPLLEDSASTAPTPVIPQL